MPYVGFMVLIGTCQIKKCKAPKRAMHKADGDLMENTTGTNQMKADRQSNQLTDGNKCGGGENAC